MLKTFVYSLCGAAFNIALWFFLAAYMESTPWLLLPWWLAVYTISWVCVLAGSTGFERRAAGLLFLFTLLGVACTIPVGMAVASYAVALLPVPFLITAAANRQKKRRGL